MEDVDEEDVLELLEVELLATAPHVQGTCAPHMSTIKNNRPAPARIERASRRLKLATRPVPLNKGFLLLADSRA